MQKIQTGIEMLEYLTSCIKHESDLIDDPISFYRGIECLVYVLNSCLEYRDNTHTNVCFPSEWLSEITEYIKHLEIWAKTDYKMNW